MAKRNSDPTLWEKRLQVSLQKQGPLADGRRELFAVLAKAKRLGVLKETAKDTYEREYSNYYPRWSIGSVKVAIQVNFVANQVQLAIKDQAKPSEPTLYYNLTQDGSVVDLDQMSPEEENLSNVEACIQWITSSMQHEVGYKISDKRRYWRKVRNVATICVSSLALVTLVFFCVRWWGYEPHEAANRERIAYNAENHQIDGIGHSIGSYELTKLPEGSLKSIPKYGGDDKDLSHPRTISITYSSSTKWCGEIKTDIPDANELVIGIEESSPFVRDRYVAAYVDRSLHVCLVNGFSDQDASEDVPVKLVLQTRSPGSRS